MREISEKTAPCLGDFDIVAFSRGEKRFTGESAEKRIFADSLVSLSNLSLGRRIAKTPYFIG